jgi:hypothetical protein
MKQKSKKKKKKKKRQKSETVIGAARDSLLARKRGATLSMRTPMLLFAIVVRIK